MRLNKRRCCEMTGYLLWAAQLTGKRFEALTAEAGVVGVPTGQTTDFNFFLVRSHHFRIVSAGLTEQE
jgi:hypothetical protein